MKRPFYSWLPFVVAGLLISCGENPQPQEVLTPEQMYQQAQLLLKPNVEHEEPDFKGALELLKKAAEAGYTRACVDMAGIYMGGSKDGSIKADAKLAFQWAAKAAAQGDAVANYLCAQLLLIDGQEQAATPYLDKAIAARLPDAYLLKAFVLLDPPHIKDILRIYDQSQRGSIMQQMAAQKSLDRIVHAKDNAEFLRYLTEAAHAGSPNALYILSRYYVAKKDPLAIQWLTEAAQCGHPVIVSKAAYTLATQYDSNSTLGIQPNVETALHWYKISADAGDARAQYILALRLLAGEGVEANEPQGEALLRLAAGQDYPPAIEALVHYLFRKDSDAHAQEIEAWVQRLNMLLQK